MRRPHGAATLLAVTLSCGAIALAGPTGGAAGASSASSTVRPPVGGLERSWTNATGTWAIAAMGHFARRSNTFWQVLFRPAGAARWTLVTPPGVASNGGFSAWSSTDGPAGAASRRGVVTAGFEPSKYLRYSPIAQTSDEGKKWSAGTLPSGLVPVADSVAGGAGGVLFALVRSRGGTLVRSDGSLTAWKPVVDRRALGATAAGRACGIDSLTAVDDPTGSAATPQVGASCTTPGVVGLFHETQGSWAGTTARVPAGADVRATFTVLRLESGASGTSALLEARRGGVSSLVALWRTGPSASWRASRPVRLNGSVLSTTTAGVTALLVVTGSGFKATGLLWVSGPGSTWRALGRPPAGTQVVAPSPGAAAPSPGGGPGSFVALSVSGSDVTVWQRSGSGAWRRTSQQLKVPIEYGSST